MVLALVWSSWLLAWGYPFLHRLHGWCPEAIGPDVPYLLLPTGTRTDVVSSVLYFVWTVIVAVICCIPTEAAKMTIRSFARPVLGYLLLLVFQSVLVGDFLRT